MEPFDGPKQFTRQGAKSSAIWLIGQILQRCRWAVLVPQSFGEGRFLKLAGLHYGFLMVNQTIVKTMPCQQTLKIGQMIPCKEETI